MTRPLKALPAPEPQALYARFAGIRETTRCLADGLNEADVTVQSMPDASPTKWHLAHTTWFFETFILSRFVEGYVTFHPKFGFLFNSYYEAEGERWTRAERGLLTRPTLQDILSYRAHVDAAMEAAFTAGDLPDDALHLVELGCQHEQQHQELLLTDILSLFALNPLHPAYRDPVPLAVRTISYDTPQWVDIDGGIRTIGHDGNSFAFDCETPSHDVLARPFQLAAKAVTNREWLDFMEYDGYSNPALWLSDGYDWIGRENIRAPGYWAMEKDGWHSMTLRGYQPVDPAAPVTHISYYEAAAFAEWSGYRLPTEAEWEVAASDLPVCGNMLSSQRLRPAPPTGGDTHPVGMFGDVWEWTASAYLPYPGFRPLPGAVGEYNGKFMSGQMVLRGGSCVTPDDHIRASYRNFFQPEKRWQFTGLRLARDA